MYILLLPEVGDVKILATSRELVEGITKKLQAWEDRDWLDVPHSKLWKELAYLTRRRGNKTTFRYLNNKKDETKQMHNKLTKLLKTEKPTTEVPWHPKIIIPPEFQIEGARLNKLTQHTAYQLINKTYYKDPSERLTTNQNIQRIKLWYENQEQKRKVTNKQIWQSKKQPWIPKKIQDFLWKLTHNAIKCGTFFRNIPNLQEKQYCSCGEIETIEHILLKCSENKIPQLWTEITQLLSKIDPTTTWPIPTIEAIQTPNLIKLKQQKSDKRNTNKQILYQIMMVETSWLVWKERNGKVFNNQRTNLEQLEQKWTAQITRRIQREWAAVKLYPPEKWRKKRNDFEERWCINNVLAKITNNELNINQINLT
ncbi:hypothetical protein BKA82DRAFT_3988152 [Pisolithus tinctorius]|nr:hypothetical protein BKA82DRAFT_3988152 [Pisolithus tinctorius]